MGQIPLLPCSPSLPLASGELQPALPVQQLTKVPVRYYSFTMKRIFASVTGLCLLFVFSITFASCGKKPAAGSSVRSLCMYQIMVSTFKDGDPSIGYTTAWGPEEETGGDLQGVIDSLDYIRGLGCNAIWLTPVFDSSGANADSSSGFEGRLDSTGYYAKDFFHIDPHFGSDETFRTLVEQCHKKGLYIFLDGVFGHWGDFVQPSPSGRLPVRNAGKFTGAAFPQSIEFFKEVAAYWIREYKIDGWRLDQCYQLGTDGDGIQDGHNYWYDIRLAVEAACAQNRAEGSAWGTLGYLVGECWKGSAREIRSSVVDAGTAQGYGLPSCFDFPSRSFVSRILTKPESSAGKMLAAVFKTAQEKGYPDFFEPNLFVSNHDVKRLGTEISAAAPAQRPDGADSKTYYQKHKLAMAILAAYTGPVTVYYGDEWGAFLAPERIGTFPCYEDNASRTAGKTGYFSGAELDVRDYASALFTARQKHPALYDGANQTILAEGNVYIGKKTLGRESIIYLLNCGDEAYAYRLEKGGRNLLTGKRVQKSGSLPPWSALFIEI